MENNELTSKEKKKIRDKEYQQSDEWKEYSKNYRNRPESILARKAYRETEKAKAAERKRRQLDHVKECVRLSNQKPETKAAKKEWNQSEKGKKYHIAYNKRPEVIAKRHTQERKDYIEKWKSKPESKEIKKKWLESYKKTAKYKSSITAQSARRRAIEKSATITDSKLIAKWFKNWKLMPVVLCYWCKNKFNPRDCEADHVMPISKGGAHSIDNLVIACKPCNRKKSAKLPTDWVMELTMNPLILQQK
jgi:5-methylcytosine-specific restriction endonuclease McrA